MSLQEDFKTFLSDIEPSKTTVEQISKAHTALRSYLDSHKWYSEHCCRTYLSGSYAKHTAIRPVKDEDNRDVDVVVETDYSASSDSANVIIELRDALCEDEKYKSARLQTHSVGISLSKLDIDVVPLAVEEGACFIGDLDSSTWAETNPKGHLEWSTNENEKHDRKFKPVVKIMKWWRREQRPDDEKWPKGITLEKIIADCFPEEAGPYEDLLIGLMENIVDSYEEEIGQGVKPKVSDPVLSSNNLSDGYSFADFLGFFEAVQASLSILREKGSSNETWRELLGSRFPSAAKSSEYHKLDCYLSVEQALRVSYREPTQWPFTKKQHSVFVVADVTFPGGHMERVTDNERIIPKGCLIDFRVIRPRSLSSLQVKWQVVNTGVEAHEAGCLRGGFEDPDLPRGGRHEETAYAGRHYVQCLVIRNDKCVAHSKEFIINVE